jgi:alkylation response protein AidB-like acyl-CoA dehydrogenase
MDFRFTEEQEELAGLARRILDQVDEARRRALDAPAAHLDAKLWSDLTDAGLVALTAPEASGGLGMGAFESMLVLEAAGAVLAAAPLVEAHVVGLLLGEAGDRAVDVVARGGTVALAVDEHGLSPRHPATSAIRSGDRWTLTGAKAATRWAADAEVLLVTAQGPERRHVFRVDPHAAGVTLTPATLTTGQAAHCVHLDGVTVGADAEAGADDDTVDHLVDLLLTARAAVQLGIVSRALQLTTDYVSERQQFGRPIGSFQGVAIRVADAYIDTECLRSAVWQAADRLGRGMPIEGSAEVAKFWAAEAGSRVLASAIHLHGGIGVTTDYPLYRYYQAARDLELDLGGAHAHLDELGDALAGGLTPEAVR